MRKHTIQLTLPLGLKQNSELANWAHFPH